MNDIDLSNLSDEELIALGDGPELDAALQDILYDLADEYADVIKAIWKEDNLPLKTPAIDLSGVTQIKVELDPGLPSGTGIVYLVAAPRGVYKIGVTKQPVRHRLKGLRAQSPVSIDFVHSFLSHKHLKAERYLHTRFQRRRSHGEWFRLTTKQVDEIKSIRDYDLDELLD